VIDYAEEEPDVVVVEFDLFGIGRAEEGLELGQGFARVINPDGCSAFSVNARGYLLSDWTVTRCSHDYVLAEHSKY